MKPGPLATPNNKANHEIDQHQYRTLPATTGPLPARTKPANNVLDSFAEESRGEFAGNRSQRKRQQRFPIRKNASGGDAYY